MFAAVLLVAMPPDAHAAPEPPLESERFSINGAGATFPFPLIDLWRVEYNNLYENVNLNYQSIGSGGGIKQHIEKTVVFAASDKPMRGSEVEQAPGTLHIPETIGGVVIAYNLPEYPSNGLHLTGGVIADIFLGKITTWNDPAVAELNPGIDLPDEEIATVQRSDGSGTTFVFTDYLVAISPEFDTEIGKGKSVEWKIGRGAAGNEGVAGVVKTTPYSIGYIELAYAFQSGINYAHIQNADGTAFIEPTLGSLAAASAGLAATGLPAAHEDWSGVTMVNAPGSDSYPIATFTYLLLYEDMEKVADSIEEARAIIHLINWMITDGQEFSPLLLYVPLDDSVTEIGQAGLKRATYEGEVLWREAGAMPDMQDVTRDTDGAASDPDGGGCLVATATYGSELAPQVQALREIRDDTLLSTQSGMLFMSGFNAIYYSFSPTIADLERQSPEFRQLVSILIAPMLSSLSIMSLASEGSELQVLALGLFAISLNAGIYVVLPVAAARKAAGILGRRASRNLTAGSR